MTTAMSLVRDQVGVDEASLSPLEGAVVEVEMAKRRADAAAEALHEAKKATAEAEEDIADAMKDFLGELDCSAGSCDSSWHGKWFGGVARSIDGAVAQLDRLRDLMLRAAAEDEATTVELPDARSLRRVHAAAKSLRYHAQRVKEGR